MAFKANKGLISDKEKLVLYLISDKQILVLYTEILLQMQDISLQLQIFFFRLFEYMFVF